MKKYLFIIIVILAIILGLYIYIGAAFNIYSLHFSPQILIGIFLICAGIVQLLGGPKPYLAYLFILVGTVLLILN
ncbi:hypothetical protein [Staphylococcus ureilyticus]|uniref:hypothetical protein n=1 Tax=Staphylococcus ureilyticus TaxID=94138 RepID=UPI0021CE1F2F|nr:hypothetical protein [Staphylococcus ureilyticus]UXS60521.1 hypothetical protein MUA21_02715 [Staphylococcus ureilyticus]